MTSTGETTVTLRAANGSSAAAIAGHVTMAMAAAAGFTPLRAERARASLAQALGACTGAVELAWRRGRECNGRIRAAPEQLAAMGRLLAELSPERVAHRLELRFVRPGWAWSEPRAAKRRSAGPACLRARFARDSAS